jgi:hypothetical protein
MILEILTLAALAAGPAPSSSPAPLPAYFIGSWTCNGVFPSTGQPIASKITFTTDLNGASIVKHHDDTSPPALYHSVEMWAYSPADKRFNAAIVDNFGGVRDFTSPGWNGNRFVWTSAPSVQPLQQFAYERSSENVFTLDWRVSRDGSTYVVGDTFTCTRDT